MTENDFDTWASKFGGAWAMLDPTGALSMLSKDVEYYETAFSPPCKNFDEVEKLWRVITTNQENVTFKHDVVMTQGNMGLIHWRVTRTTVPEGANQEFDGVFLVRLNDEGLCTMFKQWRAQR